MPQPLGDRHKYWLRYLYRVGPVTANAIDLRYTRTLINHGFVEIKEEHFSITEKGRKFVEGASNV